MQRSRTNCSDDCILRSLLAAAEELPVASKGTAFKFSGGGRVDIYPVLLCQLAGASCFSDLLKGGGEERGWETRAGMSQLRVPHAPPVEEFDV